MTFYGDAGEVKFLHSPVCICIEQSNEASCIVMNTLRPNVVPFISIDIRNIPVVASSYVGQWCIKNTFVSIHPEIKSTFEMYN